MEVLVRGRKERRYLTEKYQARQISLARQSNIQYPYDPQRYLRRDLAVKQRFLDILAGNYVILSSWQESNFGIDGFYERPDVRGRLRRHSFSDCGRKHCPSCSNPRRRWSYSGNNDDKITLQERRANLHLKEEVEFFNNGENNV